MEPHKTFAEFLRQRDAAGRGIKPTLAEPGGDMVEPMTRDDAAKAGMPGELDHVSERSVFRNPFKGVFKAVNPARPASPLNSRLLASPFRKPFRSQVIGK